jgi:hypothetical protein
MHRVFIAMLMSLVLSAATQADDKVEHGEWSSQFQEGMGEATTHENGMSVFGMLCGAGSCRYYFANSTVCEASSTYPLMITTNEGALAVDAVCEPMNSANGEVMLYWFNETATMNQAFKNTPTVGFAFPMTNGQFKISTFSMDGFNEAVDRMVKGLRKPAVPAEAEQANQGT